MSIGEGELLLRLAVATVLCGLIGLERESRDQVAGLRTHMLVGIGAALFTLVSAYGFEEFSRDEGPGDFPRYDPTRIAAQIVTGVGFLGAGAIIRQGFNVRGVTTAAALWISAAVGMAAGAGYYLGAVATTILVLAALIGFRLVRPAIMSTLRSDFVVLDLDLEPGANVAEAIAAMIKGEVRIEAMDSEIEGDRERATFELRLPPRQAVEPLLRELSDIPGVAHASALGVHSPSQAMTPD